MLLLLHDLLILDDPCNSRHRVLHFSHQHGDSAVQKALQYGKRFHNCCDGVRTRSCGKQTEMGHLENDFMTSIVFWQLSFLHAP